MAKRSPILGFNHNFRHRGLVFHVQTEDSGVDNPHIFTHLFNGGVILSSRKLTYDSGAANEVVKALMQAQHKAMLKDLKRGDFDDKIQTYFADDPNLEDADTLREPSDLTDPSAPIPRGDSDLGLDELELEIGDIEVVESDAVLDSEAIEIEVVNAGEADGRPNPFDSLDLGSVTLDGDPMDTLRGPAPPSAVGETPSGAVLIHAAAPDSAPEPPGANPTRPGQYQYAKTGKIQKLDETDPAVPDAPAPPLVPTHAPAGKAATREATTRPRTATRPLQSEPDTVPRIPAVVEKPSVIVGAPPQVIGQPTKAKPPRRAREQAASSLFGKDLISEKSLDEVILAYLSEDGSERE